RWVSAGPGPLAASSGRFLRRSSLLSPLRPVGRAGPCYHTAAEQQKGVRNAMFLTKVTSARLLILTACVLASGVSLPAAPATPKGQTSAKQKGSPQPKAMETVNPQELDNAALADEAQSQPLAKIVKAATALLEINGRSGTHSAF